MSLDYVRRGEAVRASTVNSLIDAVAGSGSQSPDLIVTGTPRGPQFTAPTQFGSTSFDKTMLYEHSNYILSGWPMTQLMLGTSKDMCLEGIRVHKGKDIVHPISAAVVYKNSLHCPVDSDTVSGYVLSAKNFGEDKAAGATGWVKTSMEGLKAGDEVKMEVWSISPDMYQVFTNTDDDNTKKGLSIALKDNNVPLSALSSLQKDFSWTLKCQNLLSSKVGNEIKWTSTSFMTLNHGQKDVYETGDVDLKAVLKAKLAMYYLDTKETEDEEDDVQYWTWLLPMGPGAQYDDETSCVWMSQLTYGGNPILLEVPKKDLDKDYDGEAAWIEDLGCVAFKSLSSEGGAEVDGGELWLNLDYKYEKYAVVGTLDEAQGEESNINAGMPSKTIFIASAEPFNPQSDTAVMQEAPLGTLTHGTFGDMFKDGPKLDTYTPLSSGVEMKSLNWTTRGEDMSAVVDCHCMQLYNFDKAELLDTTSADWLVGRRYNSDTSCAEIVYLPPDVPDSSIDFAQTSSVQRRTVLTSDSDGNDVSVKVLQMYNFDHMGQYYRSISAALEEGKQHIVLRNSTLSSVEYLALSALDGLSALRAVPDADVPEAELSSIQTRKLDDDTEVLQLYKFDDDDSKDMLSTDDIIVRRDDHVDYVSMTSLSNSISTVLSSSIVTVIDKELSGKMGFPDADVQEAGLSSVQTRELNNGKKVVQLFKFNIPGAKAALSTDNFVVRRNDHVEYVDPKTLPTVLSSSIVNIVNNEISGLSSVPPDADVPEARLSSIQTRELSGGSKVLELYQFETPNIETVYLSAQNRYDFVMRDRTDHCIKYANLSGVGTTLSGTDNSSHYGHEFKFRSADDSNVIVNVDANGNVTIGCYYL